MTISPFHRPSPLVVGALGVAVAVCVPVAITWGPAASSVQDGGVVRAGLAADSQPVTTSVPAIDQRTSTAVALVTAAPRTSTVTVTTTVTVPGTGHHRGDHPDRPATTGQPGQEHDGDQHDRSGTSTSDTGAGTGRGAGAGGTGAGQGAGTGSGTRVDPSAGTGAGPGTGTDAGTGSSAGTTAGTGTSAPAGTVATATASGPSTGWHSGASGDSAASGGFGLWRGKPIQVTAVWGDTTAQEQTQISALDAYAAFDGDVDVSVGALAPGDTWAQAAQGAYTERWRQALQSIKNRRSGHSGTTYIRFAHEMNGDWFAWKVTSANLADFHTAWRAFHDLLAQEYPTAKLVFSPNSGNHSDVSVSQIYPGDDLVDAIGVDFYDGWPNVLDQAAWDNSVNATEQNGQPLGVGSWQKFAAQHGKPLAFPEWGLRDGDHPAFVKAMHDFLTTNAAKTGDTALAGKVIYDVYFDIANSGNQGFMLTGSANPQAAALYRSLAWGS